MKYRKERRKKNFRQAAKTSQSDFDHCLNQLYRSSLSGLRFPGWRKELRVLRRRQNRAERVLYWDRKKTKMENALRQKQVRQLIRRMDRVIYEAYYRPGGIRYYARLLSTRLAVADDSNTPEELKMFFYESTLRPLSGALNCLQNRCRQIEAALKKINPHYSLQPWKLKNARLLKVMTELFAESIIVRFASVEEPLVYLASMEAYNARIQRELLSRY